MRGLKSPAFLCSAVLLLLPALAACGGAEGDGAVQRSPFSPGETVPAIAATPVPTPTMADVTLNPVAAARAALDATISAASHEDVAQLLGLVRYTVTGCENDAWPRPACPPSIRPGTEVSVFPYVACGAYYADAAELEGILVQILRARGPRLYALVRTAEAGAGTYFPKGPYVAIFQTDPPFGVTGSTGLTLTLDGDGRIVSLGTGCRATPEELYSRLAVAEVIVPPQR